jgi:hypothetical protein
MLCAAPRQRVCTVSIRSSPGAPNFAHTTMASTVFGAVARAKEFFETDFWKGPKPTPETIYRVHLVADERGFRCRPQPWNDGNGTTRFEDTHNVSRPAKIFQEI